MEKVLVASHLTKTYGRSRGIDDVSIQVPRGAVFGFLGPNGAGKTTTISTVVDLIRPTKGSVQVFGLDSHHDSLEIRRRIGFLAGDMALDGALTGQQQLEYFGHIRGNYDKKYIAELANRLGCDLKRKIKSLSRGNRQKVALISALMHRPELLILDEPTSGLDPLVQASFNEIILERQRDGATTFISSHILDEVQEICNHVAFIREGRIVAHDSVENIMAALPQQISLRRPSPILVKTLKSHPGITSLARNDGTISFTVSGDIKPLLRTIASQQFEDISIARPSLETIFMKYYRG